MAVIVLVFSTALFFFYCQVTIQKILRRVFDAAFFQIIVAANNLEFPALRRAPEKLNSPVDYARLRVNIKCDFLTLTYLLKNAANIRQDYSFEERLLMLYFRFVLVSMTLRHWLRLSEKPAILAVVDILQYFANIVGERINSVRISNFSAVDYILGR